MNLFKKKEETGIRKAIQDRIKLLDNTIGDPEEDRINIDNIKVLADIEEKVEGPQIKVNPNTIISVFGSLIGVGMIIFNEKYLVMNTKSWPFIPKIGK